MEIVGEVCRSCAQKIKQLEIQRDELLAALCYLHATSTGQTHEQWLEAMSMAEAAIAKATGQEVTQEAE